MSVSGRTRPRLALQLPMVVTGQDADGRRFTESTTTRNVSAGGICFDSHHDLPIGGRIDLAIELPLHLRKHFGGKSRYAVRAMVCRVEHTDPLRIGARFLKALD